MTVSVSYLEVSLNMKFESTDKSSHSKNVTKINLFNLSYYNTLNMLQNFYKFILEKKNVDYSLKFLF